MKVGGQRSAGNFEDDEILDSIANDKAVPPRIAARGSSEKVTAAATRKAVSTRPSN